MFYLRATCYIILPFKPQVLQYGKESFIHSFINSFIYLSIGPQGIALIVLCTLDKSSLTEITSSFPPTPLPPALCYTLFWDRISLNFPGWPWTCDLSVSAFQTGGIPVVSGGGLLFGREGISCAAAQKHIIKQNQMLEMKADLIHSFWDICWTLTMR